MLNEQLVKVDMEKIISFVKKEFKDSTDKNGEPYFCHLERVAEEVKKMCNYDHIVALAWLHDVLENTEWEIDALQKELDLSGKFMYQLQLLTKNKNEKYDDYIDRILRSNDVMVLQIKLCDLKDNTNTHRLHKLFMSNQITLDDCYRLMIKYLSAYRRISEYLFHI